MIGCCLNLAAHPLYVIQTGYGHWFLGRTHLLKQADTVDPGGPGDVTALPAAPAPSSLRGRPGPFCVR